MCPKKLDRPTGKAANTDSEKSVADDMQVVADIVSRLCDKAGGRTKSADVMRVSVSTLDNYRKGVTQPKMLEFLRLQRAADEPIIEEIARLQGVQADFAQKLRDVRDGAHTPNVDTVALAGSVARAAAKKSPDINLDPDAFADFFMEMLRHAIETEASSDQVDNVVSFAVKRALR